MTKKRLPDLILLHGALGSKEQFNLLVPLLSDHFNIHKFNFYGHGGKVCTESFSIDGFVRDALTYLELNGIEKARFFGFSMGGYVALQLGQQYPDVVEKVMTLGTKLKWTPESVDRELIYLDVDTIKSKVPEYAAQLDQRHDPVDWKEVVKRTADMLKNMGGGAGTSITDFDLRQPVLISRGSLDNMVSSVESKALAQHLDNALYHEFLGMKHPLEKADLKMLSDKIIEFLS